jgi:predicted RNA binding protein YcfA (HicA-like mRNA interferase family)
MSRLPAITPNEMVRVLKRLGFELDHQHGSHAFYVHPDGRTTTIAIHRKDLPRGTMIKILRDIGISNDDFLKLL